MGGAKRNGKRKGRGRRKSAAVSPGLGDLLGWLSFAFGLVIIGTVLWVGVYRFMNPPSTYLMTTQRWSGTHIAHHWIPIEAVAPVMWEAVIASEDQNFCKHSGFDQKAIDKAIKDNERGGRLRGASTISQQTAKNVFLWPGRNFLRKGLEAYFTVLMETLWPKRRIMEIYLNDIEFGRGVFGVEAASERFFGKPARNLTRYEAALLAAVLPNPKRMHPDRPSTYVRTRAATIAERAAKMRQYGMARCVLN